MDKNQTLSLLHSIDTEYCTKKKEATMRIIEARHALREKSSDREKAEEDLQNALDAYSLLNLEHQAERSKAWAGMDRTEEEESSGPILTTGKPDGIYFILKDGKSILASHLHPGAGEESFLVEGGVAHSPEGISFQKSDVAYIGIKMGETKVAVSLREQLSTLIREDAKTLDEEPSYCDNWEQARIFRTNGKGDTRYIVEQGTDIKLAPNEYIPSLWELQIIYLNRYLVDKVLDFLGEEKLKDDWYWSSTSRSANNAWYLNFTYGYQHNNRKSTHRYRVRPVSAIIW